MTVNFTNNGHATILLVKCNNMSTGLSMTWRQGGGRGEGGGGGERERKREQGKGSEVDDIERM